ncbi:prephenate dehydrogenase/arogenate dehydrogenase family protein [Nitrososphaera viennensis]|uniref:Prephenate dehydrogenase/arogenate dehydrogenase family protein n=2 Tax=Nitrososphaera viennensis TaxID=1034015 RepID=A0A977IH42_9ARCH|nr:prephenate dehydrogenase/arogenate dehydrogenase family protein [Nitrososphaera viennensis]AIC14774.1 putative prephenate dehydrogenase [Nitrososphaera viennensis EN76]UVS70613.1 prephenate dehydrogenase/arogenate dehydrogenase family protein [Nitrososphaera viennensis]
MQVAIIGAAGKMGTWFCGYFARQSNNNEVSAFDVKPFEIKNVKNARNIADCVKNADLVMVCVPVKHTPAVIKQCAKAMRKQGALLAEISSIKAKALPALKKTQKDIVALCIHPMFGPGAGEKKQLKMLAVPVRNKEKELGAINNVFAGMSVKVLPDARTHDRAIAAVLGLTYFSNVAFAGMLAREDLATLNEVGGTTFAIQSMLAQSVMTDEPELIAALIRDNPHAQRYMRQYMKEAGALASAKGSLLEARLTKTKKRLQKQADLDASYRRMYGIIELLGRPAAE